MILNQIEIEAAALLIGAIDGGEKDIFLDTLNTENQVEAKIFGQDNVTGVFYSCSIFGGLRVYIAFETDTGVFNEDLEALVQSALRSSGFSSCLIWIRNENTKIIEFLKAQFRIQPDCGAYYYASIEYIMRRAMFDRTTDKTTLDIRPYEEKHIDRLLSSFGRSYDFRKSASKFQEE